jgi:hypothetical protein
MLLRRVVQLKSRNSVAEGAIRNEELVKGYSA